MKTKTYNLSVITLLVIVLTSFPVMAQTLTSDIPSQVEPGESFTVTYQTANAPSGRWFVGWDESVVGGCTPTEVNDFMVSQTGGDKSSSSSFTAPPSGSCTFSGFYQYADGTQTNFPTRIVSVNSGGDSTGPTCGDSICEIGETESSCPADCSTDDGDTGNGDDTDDDDSDEESTGWCSIAEGLDFLPFTENPCRNGTILISIIGGLVLLFLLKK